MRKLFFVFVLIFLFCFQAIGQMEITQNMGKVVIKNYPRYQQVKEYTCGPAVLLALANFYRGDCDYPLTPEMEQMIEDEAGTVPWSGPNNPAGTNPEQMKNWLVSKGFIANLEFETLGDESGLRRIKENVLNGVPSIVAWSDWGGHWTTVIGYDDKNTGDIMDDVLIFADPYDRVDGKKNSRTRFSAYRFYWMWFEALCFDPLGPPTWRTLITAE